MKKVIGETICWNMTFEVIELENEKLKNHYCSKKVRWAHMSKPDEIHENKIINVGTMFGEPSHYLIKVAPNEADQVIHEEIAANMKKELDIDIEPIKEPWLMWATYNQNLYSTFEIID
jgi:hypothetical protein